MARVLLFDVNETLLDLRVLDPVFERAFGDASIRRHWFGLVLRNAMTLTITGDYENFIAVGPTQVANSEEKARAGSKDNPRAMR